jgi:hypothetical protein
VERDARQLDLQLLHRAHGFAVHAR